MDWILRAVYHEVTAFCCRGLSLSIDIDSLLKLGGSLFAVAVVALGFWRAVKNSISTRNNVATLSDSVKALNDSKEILRREVDALQRQLEEKNRSSLERDVKIDNLTEQVRQSQNTGREIERTNAMLQGRLAEQREILGTQITQQAAEIALLRLDVKNRDIQVSELKQSHTDKEAALTQANVRLNEAGATIARLEGELAQEKTEREKLDQRVKALERQVQDMKAEREQIIAERDQALADLAKAREEIERLKDELKKFETAKSTERPAEQPGLTLGAAPA